MRKTTPPVTLHRVRYNPQTQTLSVPGIVTLRKLVLDYEKTIDRGLGIRYANSVYNRAYVDYVLACWVEQKDQLYLAHVGKALAGFVVLGKAHTIPDAAGVLDLYIEDTYRRRGVGDQVMGLIITKVSRWKPKPTSIVLTATNHPKLDAFYQRNHYTPIRTVYQRKLVTPPETNHANRR